MFVHLVGKYVPHMLCMWISHGMAIWKVYIYPMMGRNDYFSSDGDVKDALLLMV